MRLQVYGGAGIMKLEMTPELEPYRHMAVRDVLSGIDKGTIPSEPFGDVLKVMHFWEAMYKDHVHRNEVLK